MGRSYGACVKNEGVCGNETPEFKYNNSNKRSMEIIICLCLMFVVSCGPFFFCCLGTGGFTAGTNYLTWTANPTTTQTITWLMPHNSLARVQYLKVEEFENNFDSAQQLEVQGTIFDSNKALYLYTANLTGLAPDTRYVYRVGKEGAWSQPTVFTTAAETENFSFLYMGDIQSGYPDWGSMLDSVYETHPDIKFTLLGGDLTDKGYDVEEWGEFLDAATNVFSRIPAIPTLGNHDGLMYQKFLHCQTMALLAWSKEFYSFDYGNAHFVILNSGNNTSATVKQWLQQDLETTDKMEIRCFSSSRLSGYI